MSSIEVSNPTLKIYTGQAAKILKFLQGGCNEAQAAEAVGVSPSYVSQLCAETDFKAQIAAKLQEDFENAIETDKNYAYVELMTSRKLKELSGYILGLDDLLKTTKILNGNKRKVSNGNTPGQPGGTNTTNITVQLVIPRAAVQEFVINPNSEVVQSNGRDLVTLNASSLDALVASSNITDIEMPPKIENKQSKPSYAEPVKVSPNGNSKDKYAEL